MPGGRRRQVTALTTKYVDYPYYGINAKLFAAIVAGFCFASASLYLKQILPGFVALFIAAFPVLLLLINLWTFAYRRRRRSICSNGETISATVIEKSQTPIGTAKGPVCIMLAQYTLGEQLYEAPSRVHPSLWVRYTNGSQIEILVDAARPLDWIAIDQSVESPET